MLHQRSNVLLYIKRDNDAYRSFSINIYNIKFMIYEEKKKILGLNIPIKRRCNTRLRVFRGECRVVMTTSFQNHGWRKSSKDERNRKHFSVTTASKPQNKTSGLCNSLGTLPLGFSKARRSLVAQVAVGQHSFVDVSFPRKLDGFMLSGTTNRLI